jgi:hypothetical protein
MTPWLTSHPWTVAWVGVVFYAVSLSLVLR